MSNYNMPGYKQTLFHRIFKSFIDGGLKATVENVLPTIMANEETGLFMPKYNQIKKLLSKNVMNMGHVG